MRKFLPNKWFALSLLLMMSLSAFSIVAYKNARAISSVTKDCCKTESVASPDQEMLWDVLSRQFYSISN